MVYVVVNSVLVDDYLDEIKQMYDSTQEMEYEIEKYHNMNRDLDSKIEVK